MKCSCGCGKTVAPPPAPADAVLVSPGHVRAYKEKTARKR